MNILTALRDVQRIYLDTAPLIYLVEERIPSAAKMDWIVNLIETTPLEAFSAVLTVTEVMVQPLRMGDIDLAQEYHDLLVQSSDYRLVSVTADIAVSAVTIRARYHCARRMRYTPLRRLRWAAMHF